MKKERRGTIAPPHNLRERACGDDFRVSGGGEGVPIRGVGVCCCCCCLGFAGETVQEDGEGLGMPVHVEEEAGAGI